MRVWVIESGEYEQHGIAAVVGSFDDVLAFMAARWPRAKPHQSVRDKDRTVDIDPGDPRWNDQEHVWFGKNEHYTATPYDV